MKVSVWHKATGEELAVEPVDAKELCATGEYSSDKPEDKPQRAQRSRRENEEQ